HATLHLGLLHQLAVRAHTLLGERLRELVRDECSGVQTGQGDELPAVSESTEALDVGLLLVTRHGLLPVERGGQVVGKSIAVSINLPCLCEWEVECEGNLLLLGPDGVHTISKLLGLLVVGHLALHPNQISKWRKRNSTVDGA